MRPKSATLARKFLSSSTFLRLTYGIVPGRVSDQDPVFLPGSGSGFQISLHPDPVSNFSASGFQISEGLDLDPFNNSPDQKILLVTS